MAKAKPKEPPNESTLERTARLARKLLGVPKAEVEKRQRVYDATKRDRGNPQHRV